MRISVVYFSLLLQSLYALPALCASYHVHSSAPKRCIVSTGRERAGESVKTVAFHNGCPPDTIIHTGEPVSHEVTHGVVSGKTGLYIGTQGKPSDGKELVWVRNPYTWQFNPSTSLEFHVISVSGKNIFWDVNPNKTGSVELAKGPITEGDIFWGFDAV
ncbi:hypothetical protein AX15_006875 [Amanita polypyramis BW_CC]|nr:hypothetical protein AX15_006875 [Amanita polypyramis BW_CC]